jgi:hypothetical protein
MTVQKYTLHKSEALLCVTVCIAMAAADGGGEMLTVFARPYMFLGAEIQDIRSMFFLAESRPPDDPDRALTEDEKQGLVSHLNKLLDQCDKLDLPVSKNLIESRLNDPPKSGREFELLIDALYAEIKDKLFVFVPERRRKFFHPRNFMSDGIKPAFPKGRIEMAEAGRAYAVGLFTACVFHSMRAVEIGLRAMAADLSVQFPFPLEQADWEGMIRQIESKIAAMKDLPKSAQKDQDQHFYSGAAIQFRYFKDAWRIRVAHSRGSYDETSALGVIEHATTFLQHLSKRVKEVAN